ncbi:uncharacterized protein [Amphiura filiformis]|uniref:uncharacterized protein n=1 Tax=Amphiura filiformis TaxID=82378 RepID=UPI003B216233
MSPDQYGKWEDTDCQSNAAYVCMVPKVPGDEPTTNKPTLPSGATTPRATVTQGNPEPQAGLSAGAVVGVCFAVLIIFLATLLVGFFFYKRQVATKSPDVVGLQTTSFENVLYNTNQGVNIDSKAEATPGSDA